MKKWIALPLLLCVLLAGYVVAGPYLALRGISQAIEQRDTDRLQRHVDFAALRVNLKAQLNDYLVRKAGISAQSNLFGAAAIGMASAVAGAGVDTMVTPAGIAALLAGHGVWNKALGNTVGGDTYAPPVPAQPLKDAEHHFQSTSRFTATTYTAQGQPITLIISRQGLRWKLTNIELPLQP